MISGFSDSRWRQRLLLAFGLAIAVHEIAIGAAGFLRVERDVPERTVPATRVVLTQQATAIPTPRVEPRRQPTPPPRATPATHREVAAPQTKIIARRQHSGGSSGGAKLEVHVPKTVAHRESLPIWWSAPHGSKTVANTGQGTAPTAGPDAGAGSGTGIGTGAGSENGNGGGTGGNGSGVVNADAPCGEPVFYGLRARFNRRDGSFDEDVRVELRLGNGQKLSGDFHYPWRYPSERDNPFSERWKGGPDDMVAAQLPPPGLDLSKEPLAVQLTLKYTLPNGLTRFASCPGER